MWGKWDLGSDPEQPGEGATVKARLAQPLTTAAAPVAG